MFTFNDRSSDQKNAVSYNSADQIDAYVGTGTSQAVTVKVVSDGQGNSATARYAAFSATGNFYVKWVAGGTAVIPTANVTDGSASELNPTTRNLRGITSFAIIASAGTVVTISWFN